MQNQTIPPSSLIQSLFLRFSSTVLPRVNKAGRDHPYNPNLGKCWEWNGAIGSHGYGVVTITENGLKMSWLVHRLSYTVLVGNIPSNLCILHSCDNRKCCNPAHLFTGTRSENVADMRAKNRGGEGHLYSEAHPNCKITWEQVEEIRRRCAQGEQQSILAKEIGCHRTSISK